MTKKTTLKATVTLLLVLSLGLATGCQTQDTSFCSRSHRNIGDSADGDSAPFPVTLIDGQKIVITYTASIEAGTARWQVLDDGGQIIWQQAIQPSSQPIQVSPPDLKPGSYSVVQYSERLGKHAICWLALPG